MRTRLVRAMEAVEASITDAWSRLREIGGLGRDEDLARVVLDAPGDHDWRLVDAALELGAPIAVVNKAVEMV